MITDYDELKLSTCERDHNSIMDLFWNYSNTIYNEIIINVPELRGHFYLKGGGAGGVCQEYWSEFLEVLPPLNYQNW